MKLGIAKNKQIFLISIVETTLLLTPLPLGDFCFKKYNLPILDKSL